VTPLPRFAYALWSATAVVVLLAVLPPHGSDASVTSASSTVDCTVSGTPGDDVINATSGDDVICGLEGNDQIDGAAGNDVLVGGAGDDLLRGGDGNDVASFEMAPEGIVADLGSGAVSGEGTDVLETVENLIGSAGDDALNGTGAPNTLSGLGGTDLLFGLGGPDTLLGGDGEDYLAGSAGSLLDGGEGTDTCPPESGAVARISCLLPSPEDEDDAHGFLDVKRVDALLDGAEPVWKIFTISRWSAFKMWDRGFVLLYLDTFGAGISDYYALIRSTGNRLRASLFRNGHKMATLRVWRRSSRSVSIGIPLRKLLVGDNRRFYRWRVVTLTDRCRRTCFDQIPDQGAMVEPLATGIE
jgi:RTX calcium-binding nonapeptide repeat (4 copies)